MEMGLEMVGRPGFEPGTSGLKVCWSVNGLDTMTAGLQAGSASNTSLRKAPNLA